MARKSRKNNSQPEPKVEIEQVSYVTAIYARLSVENSGKQDEGASLQNQIDVCKEYVAGCPYLRLSEIYADNGKTGTVFDRPAWNRLMDDVRSGKVEAIVVRDLSRFGRDYIEVGNYLEKIFPALGTRFISVKENFDNFTCGSSMESLSVSLQNLINALYSRDISRKVSTALLAQQKNGTFQYRNPPYGYMWNEDKSALAIDEGAAPYVRSIFRWKLEGTPVSEMLRRLEEAGASNPELRKRQNGCRHGDHVGKGWVPSSINSILENPVYLGHTVHGRMRTALYKGVKKHKEGPEHWIWYENTHPAIISQKDFDAVQDILQKAKLLRQEKLKQSVSIREQMVDLFPQKIFCADCLKRMYFRRHCIRRNDPEKWLGSYACSTFTSRRHEHCTKHYIRQDVLNQKVLDAIQDQLQIALNYERLLSLLRGSKEESNLKEKYNAAVSSINLKLNALNQKRSKLYESYVDGILDEGEYAFAKRSYEKEHERLEQLLDEAIQRRAKFLDSISPDNKWMSMMKAATSVTELTQKLIDTMIVKILVHENGAIEIIFYYDDVYRDMCQSVLEMQKKEETVK